MSCWVFADTIFYAAMHDLKITEIRDMSMQDITSVGVDIEQEYYDVKRGERII